MGVFNYNGYLHEGILQGLAQSWDASHRIYDLCSGVPEHHNRYLEGVRSRVVGQHAMNDGSNPRLQASTHQRCISIGTLCSGFGQGLDIVL